MSIVSILQIYTQRANYCSFSVGNIFYKNKGFSGKLNCLGSFKNIKIGPLRIPHILRKSPLSHGKYHFQWIEEYKYLYVKFIIS